MTLRDVSPGQSATGAPTSTLQLSIGPNQRLTGGHLVARQEPLQATVFDPRTVQQWANDFMANESRVLRQDRPRTTVVTYRELVEQINQPGLGRHDAIAAFGKNILSRWKSQGQMFVQSGDNELGQFLDRSSSALIAEIDRCQKLYTALRKRLKDSWWAVRAQVNCRFSHHADPSFRTFPIEPSQRTYPLPLTPAQAEAVAALRQKLTQHKEKFDLMLSQLQRHFSYLSQQRQQLEASTTRASDRQYYYFRDVFQNRDIPVCRRTAREDGNRRRTIHQFYREYTQLLNVYEIYLQRFKTAVRHSQTVFQTGLDVLY